MNLCLSICTRVTQIICRFKLNRPPYPYILQRFVVSAVEILSLNIRGTNCSGNEAVFLTAIFIYYSNGKLS